MVRVVDKVVEKVLVVWPGCRGFAVVGLKILGPPQAVIGLVQNLNVGATYCPLVMKENQ